MVGEAPGWKCACGQWVPLGVQHSCPPTLPIVGGIETLLRAYQYDLPCVWCGTEYASPSDGDPWHGDDCPITHVRRALARIREIRQAWASQPFDPNNPLPHLGGDHG